MATNAENVRAGLDELGPIYLAGLIREALTIAKDSQAKGDQAKHAATTVMQLASDFIHLQSKAVTPAEVATFDAFFANLISDLGEAEYQISADKKVIVVPLLRACGLTAADFAD